MGKKRFTLVGANESQAQTTNVKATAPVEKKKPLAVNVEGEKAESAADKFLREHKEREEAKAGNSSENQNQQ